MAASDDPQSIDDRPGKSASAFRTISEVATELDLPQHVLRFWETKFQQLKPLKRGGGRRYYRPEDIQLLRRIRDLLYIDGYTIKGVQKLMRQSGGIRSFVAEAPDDQPNLNDASLAVELPGSKPTTGAGIDADDIRSVLRDLKKIRDDLVEGLS